MNVFARYEKATSTQTFQSREWAGSTHVRVCPDQPTSEFEKFYQSTGGSHLHLLTNCHCHCHFQLHIPALTMSVLNTPTSPSDSQTSSNGFRRLTLTQADIAATMSMAASRIRASITQYQMEAAHTEEPSAARIMHFKAGLQWEIGVRD